MRDQPSAPSPIPVITPGTNFVCGPDVTEQVVGVWKDIQRDFRLWTRPQKIQACNKILLPINKPKELVMELLMEILLSGGKNLERLKAEIRAHADINGWDVLPLYQGASQWLRSPPVYDRTTNGPCGTPSSSDPNNADPFADGHEDENTCSNTVQVAGKCWLNGSVNYGTFGIMVRECSDFADKDMNFGLPNSKDMFNGPLRFNPVVRNMYSLAWATGLVRGYKKFGAHPEGATVPIAWMEATFNGGPTGTPSIPGNRPKCKCSCGCKGDAAGAWDYVWEPIKAR